jgi:hypothetical protein
VADAKGETARGGRLIACFSVGRNPGSSGSNQTLDKNHDLTPRAKRLLSLFSVALEPMLGLEYTIHCDRAYSLKSAHNDIKVY